MVVSKGACVETRHGRGTGSASASRRVARIALFAALIAGCPAAKLRSVHADLVASSSALDFGPTTLGIAVHRQLTLTVEGLVAADIRAVTLDLDDGTFSHPSLPSHLGVHQSITWELAFGPDTPGHQATVLHVLLYNGPEVRVALSGTGVDARALPQNALAFGRPALGAVRHRTLLLRNDAETPVPAAMAMAGRDAAEFSIAPEVLVAPYSEVSVDVSYSPVEWIGPRQVHVELVSCPLCSPTTVPVTADAAPVPFVVDPDPIDMGDVAIDTERHLPVTFFNLTDEDITVPSIAIAAGGGPGFGLESFTLPLTLLPGIPNAISVTFTPQAIPQETATLVIESNADPTPVARVPMSGLGGGRQLVVTPLAIQFKTIPAGGRSLATFTVENGGADPSSAPLVITGLTLSSGPFVLTQGIPPSTQLAVGDRQVVTVEFAPVQPGTFSGSIAVASNDPVISTQTVSLTGTASLTKNCLLQEMPLRIDFGNVPVGKTATLGTKITNVGTDPCSLWNGLITGDPSFTFQKVRAFETLQPGDNFVATVNEAPVAPGAVAGTLSFQTSSVATPTISLSLTAGSDPAACLVASPGALDFGSERLACTEPDQTVTWTNECAGPVTVTSIAFGTGTEPGTFSIARATSTPATLQPGQQVQATVAFTPQSPGYSIWPLFATASDTPLPHLVPVGAEVVTDQPIDQTFVQTQPGKVDLLWVIDNTASMGDKRASLAASIGSFLQTLDSESVDYQIGVTTTGVNPAPPTNGTPACPGGLEGGEAGRLFPADGSAPRIVTPSMANRAAVLQDNLNVGGCQSVQEGLLATELALSPPLIDNADDPNAPQPNSEGNLGFVRSDASLAVVVVSDEDDGSPGTVTQNVQSLQGLKPTTPLTFSAITTPAQGCAIGTQPGVRYIEVSQAIGGVVASICDPNWSDSLNAVAAGLFRSRSAFPLSSPADPTTIQVTVNGKASTGWSYDAASDTVVFRAPPSPGDTIDIQYELPCQGP
jgi:spore coat protein U-like protein